MGYMNDWNSYNIEIIVGICLSRWLDEGDGENGIEQTLTLSEILVSDETEAEETTDLPGNIMCDQVCQSVQMSAEIEDSFCNSWVSIDTS